MRRIIIPLLFCSLVFAQYVIRDDVLGGGGNKLIAGNYTNRSTVGQRVAGRITNASYVNYVGFWHRMPVVVVPRLHDVGVTRLVAPRDSYNLNTPVTPACSVYNFGDTTETYRVTLTIGVLSYTDTMWVLAHQPGTWRALSFKNWNAYPLGTHAVRAYTQLVRDTLRGNDTMTGSVFVYDRPKVHDVGVAAIIAPRDSYGLGAVVTPSCSVYNYGDTTETYRVRLGITPSYAESALVADHLPLSWRVAVFPNWVATPEGLHAVGAVTALATDANPHNDTVLGICRVSQSVASGWQFRPSLPAGVRNKNVKDGGCLAGGVFQDDGCVYALKGNNTCEFFRYNTTTNTWQTLDSLPAYGMVGKKKTVKKGAGLVWYSRPQQGDAASSTVGAVKGNNSLEYWEYIPETDGNSWVQKADVPLGNKNIKEGAALAAVTINDIVYIYLLKGSNTQEFYCYNTQENAWTTKAPPPLGVSGRLFKKGSYLVAPRRDAQTIYLRCLKGGYNEFYEYDPIEDVWTTKTSLPLVGSSGRKKKAGDGAGLAMMQERVWALKGNNTQEFWSYDPLTDDWTQEDDIMAFNSRRVKGGGSLTYVGGAGVDGQTGLYATVGNNTLGFEYYPETDRIPVKPVPAEEIAVQGGLKPQASSLKLAVSPNPWCGRELPLAISYSLPTPGNVSLKLYDITGKLVTTLGEGYRTAGSSSFIVRRSSFASGIYLLKLETETSTATTKLIVE